jgi:16S rRNA (cytosine1402-N4)-methyltransferase
VSGAGGFDASGQASGAAGHVPVLLPEVLELLSVPAGGTVVDGTLGLGGHAAALAERLGPEGLLIGLDRDPAALARARERLAGVRCRTHLQTARFSAIPEILDALGQPAADAILLDLGVSSLQLDSPERGFTFREAGPLDMRMSPEETAESALDLLRRLDRTELADLIYAYGEERFSRRIAKSVVEAMRNKTIQTTEDLASVVRRAVPGRSRIDKATRTFQALRIAVNRELEELEAILETAPDRLALGGRLAVISFHSLEDRLVKRAFRERGREGFTVLTKKPLTAGAAEKQRNPRSRSAKLRGLQRDRDG